MEKIHQYVMLKGKDFEYFADGGRVSALGCPRKVFLRALVGGVPVSNNFEYFRKLGFPRPTVYFCKSDFGSLTMIYTFEH